MTREERISDATAKLKRRTLRPEELVKEYNTVFSDLVTFHRVPEDAAHRGAIEEVNYRTKKKVFPKHPFHILSGAVLRIAEEEGGRYL